MQIHRWPDAAAFMEQAGSFLERHEAAHVLLLGLAAELLSNPQLFGHQPPFYATVEVDGEVVLAMLQTPPHALALSLAKPGLHDAIFAALVDNLLQHAVALPAIAGPADSTSRFVAFWNRRTNQLPRVNRSLRIYALTEVHPPSAVPGLLRQANIGDAPLITTWLRGFHKDALDQEFEQEQAAASARRWLTTPGRGLFFWEVDQQPVSMVGTAGPTPHGIRVSAVYTPRELRGRGYASACVAAVSQIQLAQGRSFCALFTDLANPTSNKIYQQIGYRPICDYEDIEFVNPET